MAQPLTIVGISRSGIAAAALAVHLGYHPVLISDNRPDDPIDDEALQLLEQLGVEIETGGHSNRILTHAPVVLVSPGIPPHAEVMQRLADSKVSVQSEVDFAFQAAPRLVRWVGVTGTNGKTTVTKLIHWLLTEQGYPAAVCGNIGVPASQVVLEVLTGKLPADATLVAELSSYQLATSRQLRTEVAVFTNLQADHLDWHGSMEAYTAAKASLFTEEGAPRWAILNADDPISAQWSEQTTARTLGYSLAGLAGGALSDSHYTQRLSIAANGDVVLKVSAEDGLAIASTLGFPLSGQHNRQNLLAALGAVWALERILPNKIQEAIASFPGVPHRLEPIGLINGVTFINDSKATNPEASRLALEAIAPRPITLLAGGRDKGVDLAEWAQTAVGLTHRVILYGESRPLLAEALQHAGHPRLMEMETLADAFSQATLLAQPEEVVLLSPACASFDQYRNFEERGDQFKALFRAYQSAQLAEAALA